jgi:hypothetical protein
MLFRAFCIPLLRTNGPGLTKMLRIMKLTSFLLLATCLHVCAAGYSQKVSVSGVNLPIEKVFASIKQQTGYTFVYTSALLRNAKPVTIHVKDIPLVAALDQCFYDQPITYTIFDKTIIIKTRESLQAAGIPQPPDEVTGIVVDENHQPMMGVTVRNKKSGLLASTDAKGAFVIQAQAGQQLEFTFVGYKSQTLQIAAGNTSIVVKMVIAVDVINEVVITGYSSKKVAELTGSVQRSVAMTCAVAFHRSMHRPCSRVRSPGCISMKRAVAV